MSSLSLDPSQWRDSYYGFSEGEIMSTQPNPRPEEITPRATAAEIVELRKQVSTYAQLIEAQSLNLRSMQLQRAWLITHLSAAKDLLRQIPAPAELEGKRDDLLASNYPGAPVPDLLEMAGAFDLTDDISIFKCEHDAAWHLASASHGSLMNDGHWHGVSRRRREPMRFPTPEAALAWFCEHPSISVDNCA